MKYRNLFFAVAIALLSAVASGNAYENSVSTNYGYTYWNPSFSTPSFVYYTLEVWAGAGTYGSSTTSISLHDAALPRDSISVGQADYYASTPTRSTAVIAGVLYADCASEIINAQSGYGAVRVLVWW